MGQAPLYIPHRRRKLVKGLPFAGLDQRLVNSDKPWSKTMAVSVVVHISAHKLRTFIFETRFRKEFKAHCCDNFVIYTSLGVGRCNGQALALALMKPEILPSNSSS